MRPSIPLLSCVVLAGACGRSDRPEVRPEPIASATATASSTEAAGGGVRLGPPPEGLALEIARKGPKRMQAGRRLDLRVELVNRSRDRSIALVLPGDGSDFAWREPEVFWLAEIDAGDGRWVPAPRERPSRCGNFDEDWTDEVRALAPGERIAVYFGQGPDAFFDLHEGARFRVRAGYRYRAGRGEGARGPGPAVPAALAGLAPFELLSEPIEVELVHDWTLDLAVRGPLRAGQTVHVSDVFDLRVTSHIGAAVDARAPGWLHGAPVHFEVREMPERPTGAPLEGQAPTMDPGLEKPPSKLGARSSMRLLGETDRFGSYDGTWSWPVAGIVHVRAAYLGLEGVDLRSSWVAVTVE